MATSSGHAPPDRPTRCRECNEPLETPVGCMHCHTIFPPTSSLSHYDRLGLRQQYAIDPNELERRYLAWSRELHPDYFQTRSSEEQSTSLKLSASLNDAYSTLKDPVRRGEYLLQLFGGPSASGHRGMPEGFLEEVLELRMEIEEAKASGDPANPEAEALRDRLSRERRSAVQEIGRRFEEVESNPQPPSAETLAAIREQLNTVKYYDGLLRELAV